MHLKWNLGSHCPLLFGGAGQRLAVGILRLTGENGISFEPVSGRTNHTETAKSTAGQPASANSDGASSAEPRRDGAQFLIGAEFGVSD
ncbi:hypothetical protein [Nocardia sp. NBC_01009]|uniref:hypothetical protein n=1 Tax=Nocardia sp. NBC_01009 TaxID=2975996 RepID=UPI00386B0CCC|nr:hypothetical protein OHA42_26330 [Nocardia sp. NBC_01009]